MTRNQQPSPHLSKKAEWAALYQEGLSYRQIAEQAGVTAKTVKKIIGDAAAPRAKASYAHLTETWIDEYLDQNMTLSAIGRAHGVSPLTVRRYLENEGVPLRKNKRTSESKFAHLVPEWIERYQKGESVPEIAATTEAGASTVYAHLKNQVSIRQGSAAQRRYHVADPHLFDRVDTPEKAYWLGVWFGSGHLPSHDTSQSLCVLHAPSGDEELLEAFLERVGADYPLVRDAKRPDSVRLRFRHTHLRRALQAQGLTPDKTRRLAYPVQLTREQDGPFLLGYYQGKGTMFLRDAQVGIRFQLTGTEAFMQEAQKRIEMHTGVRMTYAASFKKKKDKPGSTVHQLTLENASLIRRVADWLYASEKGHLPRRDMRLFLEEYERRTHI